MTIGHGPPPSYDAVVAMDQEQDGCDKCAIRRCRRPTMLPIAKACSCPLHKSDAMEDDGAMHQILNVGNLHDGRHSGVHSVHYVHSPESETPHLCHSCGSHTDSLRTPCTAGSCDVCLVDENNHEVGPVSIRETSESEEATTLSTDNNPSAVECDQNGNLRVVNQQEDEENGNSAAELNSINNNGLIRVDMSQIIDRTGLPTYEAALKLESSGYV